MDSLAIDEKIAARMATIAKEQGVSPQALLDRLLNAEEARNAEESHYKQLIELVCEYSLFVEVCPDGSLIYEWLSGRYEHFKGNYEVGKPISLEDIHPDDLAQVRADIDTTLQNRITVSEYRLATHDGAYVWVRMTRKPIWDLHQGRVVRYYGIVQNINTQHAVEELVELQALALTSAANAIVITDRSARIEWANPAFTTLTGYTLEEALGKNPNQLVKSGVQNESFYDEMWQTILAGKVWHGQIINKRKDGSLYDEELTIAPVSDRKGNITHFIAIKQDVTEREKNRTLELERERLLANLKREQEYVTTVQHIVAALEHDIRTPLAVIASSRELLDRYFDHMSIEQRREKLASIDKQIRFVTELVSDLALITSTSMNHRGFQPSQVNLEVLCQLMVQEVQETSGTYHHMRFVTDKRVTFAYVDEVLVSRMLLNLLSNAIKYSPQHSEVTLNLSAHDQMIHLCVIDQGIGINEVELTHIFEPFYRASNAKPIGGTGLGLHIVKSCVDLHGGHIHVESRIGYGTTFTVELPYQGYNNDH